VAHGDVADGGCAPGHFSPVTGGAGDPYLAMLTFTAGADNRHRRTGVPAGKLTDVNYGFRRPVVIVDKRVAIRSSSFREGD